MSLSIPVLVHRVPLVVRLNKKHKMKVVKTAHVLSFHPRIGLLMVLLEVASDLREAPPSLDERKHPIRCLV